MVLRQLRRVAQRLPQVGAPAARCERHEIADHAQSVRPALGGSHDQLDLVREHQGAQAVVVARRRQCQHGRDLHREARLGVGAPELARAGLVHHEEQRVLALLVVRLHERVAHARRHVPVDRAEVVSLLVLAYLREFDALSTEHRAVFAREERADQGTRAELDALDLPEHFGSDETPAGAKRGALATSTILAFVLHGTPTASRIFPMTRSESMSSASASKVRSTRWRSTSKAMAFTSSGTT